MSMDRFFNPRRAGALLGCALTLCVTSGCGQDGTQAATWQGEWGHTDKGYSATLSESDGCLKATVNGTEYLAVLPSGSSVQGDTVKTPDKEYDLASEVTIGGWGASRQEAEDTVSVTIPEVCTDQTDRVWLLT